MIVSAALILLSVLRVYYFCDFNVSVAMEVLTVVSWPNILVGTALPFLITAAPLIAAYAIGERRALSGEAGQIRNIASWAALLVLAPLVVMEMPVLSVIANLVGAAFFIWQSRTGGRFTLKNLMTKFGGQLIAVAAAAGLAWITLFLPWQPSEKVTYTQDDSKVVSKSFVVGDKAGRVLLVDEYSKQPVWIDASSITGRETCNITNRGERPWLYTSISSLRQAGSYDPCDSIPGGIKSITVPLQTPKATIPPR